MHHATVDGVSGSNLISHLCSLEPDAAPLALGDDEQSGATRAAASCSARAVLGTATRSRSRWFKVLATVGRADDQDASAGPARAPRWRRRSPRRGRRSTARSPPTASIALADIDLDDIREIKKATGSTVNDVVLTLCGGALRAYLDERGELPDSSLLASVPVSVRESLEARRRAPTRCRRSSPSSAPTSRTRCERLEMLAERNRNAKDHHNAISADALQDWAEFAAPRTFGLAVRTYANLRLAEKHPVVHNLVISNVPGPPVPLYFMGARIEALYPLGPVFHGAGLNITVMSNAGRCTSARSPAGSRCPTGTRWCGTSPGSSRGSEAARGSRPSLGRSAKSRRRALTVLRGLHQRRHEPLGARARRTRDRPRPRGSWRPGIDRREATWRSGGITLSLVVTTTTAVGTSIRPIHGRE